MTSQGCYVLGGDGRPTATTTVGETKIYCCATSQQQGEGTKVGRDGDDHEDQKEGGRRRRRISGGSDKEVDLLSKLSKMGKSNKRQGQGDSVKGD